MKQFTIGTMVLALILITSITQTAAQPRFEVPLTVTDGVMSQTIYFGILPNGHFCIDPADSLNGHIEQFMIAPGHSGIFDARFIWPRSWSGGAIICFDQGSFCDYRPFLGLMQRDTFRVKSQLGIGTTMLLSWPANLATRFTQLTLRYFDQVAITNVNVNMLTNTSADVTNAGDPATVTIYAGELPLSVEQASRDVPEKFVLYQNYPNPFNPSTIISFSMPRPSFVTLKVFNIVGQEVRPLMNEKGEAGIHLMPLDAQALPSGVYFVRLTAGEFTATKKLLLTK
jgi:hypothetical protein